MEGRTSTRRTSDREIREAFIEAFHSLFPGDSTDADRSFEELFSIMPEALARHNQEDLEISYDLGNFTTNSNTPAISSENSFGNLPPELEGEMAEQNVAIWAVRQMPSYRHHTAPKFMEDQPRELKRFFEELANLFGPANITTDSEKKSQTVRYVEVDTADMWRSLPEFSNEETSYEDWKKKVVSLYPGASEEKRWSIADLDKVIGERARIGKM